MFEKIKEFMKEVINRVFKRDTIKRAIGKEPSITESMLDSIQQCAKMYAGNADWLNDDVKSLRIEHGICKEFANVCLTEMQANVSNETLDKLFKTAIRDLNENLQRGLALGSFVIKPLGKDKVEYVTADKFVPIEFDNRGRLTHVSFISEKKIGNDDYYRRFETHQLTESGLIISNKAFHSKQASELGTECTLDSVEEWANILPGPVMYAVDRPDFGYYRNPIVNTVDGSHCGVSIFDSAIDLIKSADTQFGRLEWEFESGERAINVDITALQPSPFVDANGKKVYKTPQLSKRLYKGLNISKSNGDELYEEFSPEFRDTSIINGLNAILRRIEFNVSLAYGDLSDVQDVSKTATEVKISKKRKYNMVNSIQENLKECLDDLVYALSFYNGLTSAKAELTCTFKDSILTDEETERKQDMADIAIGVMSALEYRMKWYGEDEETAKKKLPQIGDLAEEEE